MSNRDPLFDENAPEQGDVVDEILATNADKPDAVDQGKAKDMKQMGERMAEEGMRRASEGLDTAVEKLRQQGDQQGGDTAEYASMAADKLDEVSGYLRNTGSNDLLSDLEDLIRRKPIESVLVAAGIGLLLSRIVK